MNPPENTLVLCVYEKTQMQALDRTQPELPIPPGNAKRQTATYKPHGIVSLLVPLAERVTRPFSTLQRRKDLFRFLRGISTEKILEIDTRRPEIKQPVMIL